MEQGLFRLQLGRLDLRKAGRKQARNYWEMQGRNPNCHSILWIRRAHLLQNADWTTHCFSYGCGPIKSKSKNQKLHRTIFRVLPTNRKGGSSQAPIPDWGELSKIINGVSPFHHMSAKPGSHLDPMTDLWNYGTVTDSYTDFCRTLHSVDLSVHPWPMKDDKLTYR